MAEREAPIIDRINLSTAFDIIANPRAGRMALCPSDREPLIATLERPHAEFACLGVCGAWYGFLSPVPADPTPELEARHAELQARWDAGERPGQGEPCH